MIQCIGCCSRHTAVTFIFFLIGKLEKQEHLGSDILVVLLGHKFIDANGILL